MPPNSNENHHDASNVIRVAFQKDGTAEINIHPQESAVNFEQKALSETKQSQQKASNPFVGLYSRKEVSHLFNISPHRLRYWEKIDFIRPSIKVGKRQRYTFQDLISIRTAKALLDKGIALRNIRDCVEKLRQSLPKSHSPLSQLRIVTDGETVVVQENKKKIDLSSGQVLLDFQIEHFQKEIKKKISPGTKQKKAKPTKSAFEYYLEGCKLDEAEDRLEEAADAYLSAIEVDPSLTNAINNLGNLRYRQNKVREAVLLFKKVLDINPRHPEALYNMGLVEFETGDSEAAFDYLKNSIQNDPAFSDAHFNMGLVCEDLGKIDLARIHWETYLKLEPSSPWAHIAKNFLNDT